MKVAFVVESLSRGGAERVVSLLAKAMQPFFEKLYVITLYKREKEYKLSEGIERVNLQLPETNTGKLVIGVKHICRFIKTQKDCVYISFDILPNILLLLCNSIIPIKLIVCERNAPKEAEISTVSKVLRMILYPTGKHFVFQTEDAKRYYSKKIQRSAVVIGNPLVDNLEYRDQKNLEKRIIAIGRLEKQKDYELLIEAFEKFVQRKPEYRLEIYGDGSCRQMLEKDVANRNLFGKVIFYGNQINVHKLVTTGEFYVLSSDYEGMPNALLEAMAMGFPVIATDCPAGGPKMLIRDNENGILIPVKDKNTLLEKMFLLSDNAVFREKLGENALEVRKKYSLDKIAGQWIYFINKMG